jgi:hypothetical protein
MTILKIYTSGFFNEKALKKIFYKNPRNKKYIGSRESSTVEFKVAFNFGDLGSYTKIMASFANNKGGYLIFGIKDRPREIVGIDGDQFENLDTATFTEGLNDIFVPEIKWNSDTYGWDGLTFGIIYTQESTRKPIIAKKNHGDIKEGDIYYRYTSRSEKIKHGELMEIIDQRIGEEREGWKRIFEGASIMGPQNIALMDTLEGKIEGLGQTVLIDEKLLPQLKFIKKGEFSKKRGAPTLKLIGELKTAPIAALKEKEVVVGEDIYRYRATDVCREVSKTISKRFRAGSEHLKTWRLHGPRNSGKPPKKLPFRNRFCEYKEAEKDYRYSKAWIDFLIGKYSDEKEYRKLKRLPQNPKSE